MLATQEAEILDLNNLSRTEISHLLKKYQLVLSVEHSQSKILF